MLDVYFYNPPFTLTLSSHSIPRIIAPLIFHGIIPMKRFILLFITLITVCCYADEGVMWHCTATNDKGAVWNQYGDTQHKTRGDAQKACSHFNNHNACSMVCFPPRTYWRCMSHDTLPPTKDSDKNTTPPKFGTWYWTSFSKQIAINGARDACRHNSQFGGCYVDENACASS